MILGVTGLIGSGKGAVADMLVEKEFVKLGFSDIISEEVLRRKMAPTRDNLVFIGNEIRKQEGLGAWAKRLINRMEKGKNYVIEGFRNVAEVEEFRKLPEFFLIGVAAGYRRRYAWVKLRGRYGDAKNFDEFKRIEYRDLGLGEESYGQQHAVCFCLADKFVCNEGNLSDLKNQVSLVLKELGVC